MHTCICIFFDKVSLMLCHFVAATQPFDPKALGTPCSTPPGLTGPEHDLRGHDTKHEHTMQVLLQATPSCEIGTTDWI